ncbi:MAG: glycosyl hydrolase family 65 protein [Polyangia bacterium]
MIDNPHFPTEPWALVETGLDLELLAQTESLFALSNGHIGMRGNFDEGEPYGMPGTYLNAVYDLRPLPFAEAAYGYPESGQTRCNITNGKIFRLLVNDEPLDLRYGTIVEHTRRLDFHAGTLERAVRWRSPANDEVIIRSTRMVSLAQRATAAISYEVEAVDRTVRIVVQSELVANEEMPALSADPRVSAVLEAPLQAEDHAVDGNSALLIHTTKRTGIRVAVAADHVIEGTSRVRSESYANADTARVTVTDLLHPGEKLRIEKFLSYSWSHERSLHALRDQSWAAIVGSRQTGFSGLLAEQRTYLDDFWGRADVQLDGAPDLQQAVRFALFHILQASTRAEQRGIAAKGLTGTGYDGHAFWDSEVFVHPVLVHTAPQAASDALRWRLATLPLALEHAKKLNLKGAAYAWRTINGEECSGYWPAGTAAFHLNADIADACIRYVSATQDLPFEAEVAVPILVQTSRLWMSLGAFVRDGSFRIDGVTGPDEYSALADNNIYTNVMVRRNLRGARAACDAHPDEAAALGVGKDELAAWIRAADHIVIPRDEELGVHQQSEGFTHHASWPFEETGPDQYPLLLHFTYFDLYRKQVTKQADLVLAMQLDSKAFTDEEKARNFDYYERITVRDSSLSAATQAIIAAEIGHLDLAMEYLGETAFLDLRDYEKNTKDGLHLASLAGIWGVLVAGFGGMRDDTPTIRFCPKQPPGIERFSFRVLRGGRRLEVTIADHQVTYQLLEGEPLEIEHCGEKLSITTERIARPVMRTDKRLPPQQPPGRAPLSR